MWCRCHLRWWWCVGSPRMLPSLLSPYSQGLKEGGGGWESSKVQLTKCQSLTAATVAPLVPHCYPRILFHSSLATAPAAAVDTCAIVLFTVLQPILSPPFFLLLSFSLSFFRWSSLERPPDESERERAVMSEKECEFVFFLFLFLSPALHWGQLSR